MTKRAHTHTLFERLFGAIAAGILAAVLLMSLIMTSVLHRERQEAYEQEILAQLRGIANLVEESYYIYDVRLNLTLGTLIRGRVTDIYEKYNGIVWLVSWTSADNSSFTVLKLQNESWDDLETMISSEEFAQQLAKLRMGQEIRAANLFPDLGESMVTVGVPWIYDGSVVVGAVLMHVDVSDLEVNLSDLVGQILGITFAVLALGLCFAALVARSQVNPIRKIQNAVADYARGHFENRVKIRGNAELVALADSINRMADDLSNLEASRREFVANVSHELRSPLMSMQGYLQAIADGTAKPEERAQFLGVVIAETQRLSRLVNDLLELSRMDSGAYKPKTAPFDLNEMIRRAFISALPRIDEKHIEPDIQLDEALPMAYGDADRLRQVVNNLLDNAIKFSGGHIALKTAATGEWLTAQVENDGEGISEADLPHIFERFYKADKAHTSGMGTGLGLAIAQRIVEQHGGQISVESQNGKTVFSFTVPRVPKDLPSPPSQSAQTEEIGTPGP